MGASQRMINLVGRTLALVALVAVVSPLTLEAQVGLRSGMAQVALVARVAPRGAIQGVSPQRETARSGSVREASVMIRWSANTGYRLIVRGSGVQTSRIWVQASSGEFQELTAGSAVTVAQDSRRAGQWEREVRYRIESADAATGELAVLPVRYEIAINPTM